MSLMASIIRRKFLPSRNPNHRFLFTRRLFSSSPGAREHREDSGGESERDHFYIIMMLNNLSPDVGDHEMARQQGLMGPFIKGFGPKHRLNLSLSSASRGKFPLQETANLLSPSLLEDNPFLSHVFIALKLDSSLLHQDLHFHSLSSFPIFQLL